jgi:hypothetical protein
MSSFTEAISAVLSGLAQFLGIKPSPIRRIEEMDRKLAAAKASNIDRLEALKEKVKQLEAQIITKKKEYDKAKGYSKQIVGGEIQRLFREIDSLPEEEKVITGNINRISVAKGKIVSLKTSLDKGIEEDELDDIAIEVRQVFDELKAADIALGDLERVKYQPVETKPVNTEKRVSELAEEQETTTSLPPEIEKRLKELETE